MNGDNVTLQRSHYSGKAVELTSDKGHSQIIKDTDNEYNTGHFSCTNNDSDNHQNPRLCIHPHTIHMTFELENRGRHHMCPLLTGSTRHAWQEGIISWLYRSIYMYMHILDITWHTHVCNVSSWSPQTSCMGSNQWNISIDYPRYVHMHALPLIYINLECLSNRCCSVHHYHGQLDWQLHHCLLHPHPPQLIPAHTRDLLHPGSPPVSGHDLCTSHPPRDQSKSVILVEI